MPVLCIKYLGAIDYISPHTENYENGITVSWFHAPHNELQVGIINDTLEIKYPTGEYISYINDTVKVEYKKGIKFRYLDSEFVKMK